MSDSYHDPTDALGWARAEGGVMLLKAGIYLPILLLGLMKELGKASAEATLLEELRNQVLQSFPRESKLRETEVSHTCIARIVQYHDNV